MKVYVGYRLDGVCHVCVWDTENPGRPTPLPPRNDVWNHSPTGFQWGYGGSGPAQLALAILCDLLGDTAAASAWHQQFKFACVSRLAGDCWALSEEQVRQIMRRVAKGSGNYRTAIITNPNPEENPTNEQ